MHPHLFAPWRKSYIRTLEEQANLPNDLQKIPNNFIKEAWVNTEKDKDHLVVKRTKDGLIMLNRYPYVSGHLLVALGDPRPTLLSYSPNERIIFWTLVNDAVELIEKAYSPQGINIGVNQGEAGGAGLPIHLHAHILPRFSGDTNFLTSVTGVRTIPESLYETLDRFKKCTV